MIYQTIKPGIIADNMERCIFVCYFMKPSDVKRDMEIQIIGPHGSYLN